MNSAFPKMTDVRTGSNYLYETLTLLIASAIVFHAAFRVYRLYRSSTPLRNPDWIAAVVWLGISIFILLLWPNSSYPASYRKSSFLFFVSIAIFPAALMLGRPEDSRFVRLANSMRKVGVLLVCLILLGVAIQYLLFMRPGIITSDMFFYVCTARDMAAGFEEFSRYFYFPGVYTFWRIILATTNGSLESLQWSYLGILAINAFLIGGIVWRVVRNNFASVISILWYIVFCMRFGGFLGLAEPISTLPLLTGVFLWGGQPLAGRRGFLRTLALGTGLGLAIYIRQLSGPVSIGAASLLLTYFLQDKRNPIINFKHLVLLPLIALTVVVVGILFEGYGFRPLFIGLQQMPAYGKTSNFWGTLWKLGQLAQMLTVCSLIAFVLWVGTLTVKRFRPLIVNPCWQIVGFASIGGFVSLISHVARPAPHYALVAGSMLILSSMISFVVLLRYIPERYKVGPVFYFSIAMIALAPFVRTPWTMQLSVWPLFKTPVRRTQQIAWSLRPAPRADFPQVKKHIRPMEKIYVLPPSHNEVHFFLQTRYTSYGYFYANPLTHVLQQPGLQGVIVLKRKEVTPFYINFADKQFQYAQADQILRAHHYEPVVDVSTMVLWRKASSTKKY